MRPAAGGPTDQELVTRVRTGDLDAFETIFRTYYPELVRLAQATVHAQDVAEDIVSALFTNLWERRATLIVNSTLEGYLVRSTRYRVMNYVRDVRRQGEHAQAFLEDDDTLRQSRGAEIELIAAEDAAGQRAALARAFSELPARAQLVIGLRWRLGMSYEDIASAMNMSSAAVQMHASRALKLLRERAPKYLK